MPIRVKAKIYIFLTFILCTHFFLMRTLQCTKTCPSKYGKKPSSKEGYFIKMEEFFSYSPDCPNSMKMKFLSSSVAYWLTLYKIGIWSSNSSLSLPNLSQVGTSYFVAKCTGKSNWFWSWWQLHLLIVNYWLPIN